MIDTQGAHRLTPAMTLKNPPPPLAVLSPCRAFVCSGESGKKTEIRIEQRAVEWVFGIWGFLRGELDRRAAT